MMKKSYSFIYRSILISSLMVGIILDIKDARYIHIILSYYTIQSNIFCLFGFIIFQILDILKIDYQKRDMYYKLKGIMTMAILLTGIVYVVALLPNNMPMTYRVNRFGMNYKVISSFLLHIVSPILILLDYFLFDFKGNFKKSYPLLWLVFPLYYLLYVFCYSINGGEFYSIGGSNKYAYFFLDYRKIGIAGVVGVILCISIVMIVLGKLWVRLDSKLYERRKRNGRV